MAGSAIVLWAKWQILRAAFKQICRRWALNGMLSVIFALTFFGGLFCFFYTLFKFLREFPAGTLLMDQLLGMVFLIFFTMLVISNVIITLSTIYLSDELEFLMTTPLQRRSIFTVKLTESSFYSSWAFLLLSLPLFLAYGLSQNVGGFFYLGLPFLVVPFLLIPAGLGAMVTMIVTAFFPARRTRALVLILLVMGLAGFFVFMRFFKAGALIGAIRTGQFERVLEFLRMGSVPFSPHFWLTRGFLALARQGYGQMFYRFLLLVSTAGMTLQVCAWLVPRLYYRGWALAQESGREVRTKHRRTVWRPWRLFRWVPKPVRALVRKDIKTFWRDPAQWTQLTILFGLLIIYFLNVYHPPFSIEIHFWRNVIAFFNLGATAFVLSIVTTRFVYPLLSLEGRQYWIVGLAPQRRERLIWQKYWFSWTWAFVISEALTILSCHFLGVDSRLVVVGVVNVALMSFALTSLAIGLGALFPNLRERNPARIANSVGGTLNVVMSLAYIALTITLQIYPVTVYVGLKGMPWSRVISPSYWLIGFSITTFILLQAVTIYLPMRLGLRNWRKLEF